MLRKIDKDWTLEYGSKVIKAEVPGDITIDFYKANKIENPYFGDNYKEAEWIPNTDFVYKKEIYLTKEDLENERMEIIFKGIDLFANVYFNGHLLGRCENMFLEYSFSIKDVAKVGKNILSVKMQSTLKKMKEYEGSRYWACFNSERLFLRKAQCHFGWDWAPKICGYGIWQDVYLSLGSKYQISDLQIKTDIKGNTTFLLSLNYSVSSIQDPDGNLVKKGEEKKGDKLLFYLSKEPGKEPSFIGEMEVLSNKHFFSYENKKAKLWWPNGYGEHPLYKYRIELIRDNKIIDKKEGKIGYREISLLEEPLEKDRLSFKFKINNEIIYVRGSNWVPPECFTGVIKDEKYRQLISLAKKGNLSLLRVWGGGIYEKDIFYDLCDENGLLVWQDIMLACADIPEDNAHFVANIKKEIIYQVKRLRNHVSLAYWCGGNEKTGSYGVCISYGDDFTYHQLPGFLRPLDDTRPFKAQSPFSYVTSGNDPKSGDTHQNSFEAILHGGFATYHKKLNSQPIASFSSECALLGPSSLETLKKIFPLDKLWPLNSLWEERLMSNPYGNDKSDFAHRELYYAENLCHKVTDVNDFVIKGMLAHSSAFKAEVNFARANKFSGGFLNWMYDDIWPSGTWSTIDYFLEPKSVYYQMRRSYIPLYGSFIVNKDNKLVAFIANDTLKNVDTSYRISLMKFSGEIINQIKGEVHIKKGEKALIEVPFSYLDGDYLTLTYLDKEKEIKDIYSPSFFQNETFKSDLEVSFKEDTDTSIILKIKAREFARDVMINTKNNFAYEYSDNYFDLEKGEEKEVRITSKEEISPNDFVISSYTK